MAGPLIWGPNGALNLQQTPGILGADGSMNANDGAKNYIRNSTFASGLATGWINFTGGITGGLPSGTPTTGAGSASIAVSTSVPLRSSESPNNLVMSATSLAAGDGIFGPIFTVDAEDLGKVLTVSFTYQAVTGASGMNWSGILGSQTLMVYLLDATAGGWIQPAGFLGMNQNSGAGKVSATFQSSVTSGQQYRFAIVASQAFASPMSVNINSASVGPQAVVQGTPVTSSTSFTPTGSWTTNTTYAGQSWRVGDRAYFDITVATTGTPTTAALTVNLPNLTIDTTKMTEANNNNLSLGSADIYIGSAAVLTPGYVVYNNTTSVSVFYGATSSGTNPVALNGNTAVTQAAPGAFVAGGHVHLTFSVPIVGWSSNVQMSNDTDTRVVSFRASKNATQAVTANTTNIAFTVVAKDTHAAFNGTDTYTIPVSGDYLGIFSDLIDNGSTTDTFSIYKTGVSQGGGWVSSAGTTVGGGIQLITGCIAGDTITIRCGQTTTLAAAGKFELFRLSGPSVIAATESVNASYQAATGVTIGTSPTTIAFATKNYDSHSAWTGTQYNVGISGKFVMKVVMSTASTTLTATQNFQVQVVQAGSQALTKGIDFVPGNGSATTYTASGSAGFYCLAGDTLTIQASSSVATTTGLSTSFNHFELERVGN